MGGGLIGGLAGGLIGGATGVLLAYPQLDELGLKTEDERQEYVTSSGLAFGIVGAVIGGIIGGTIGSFSDTAPPGLRQVRRRFGRTSRKAVRVGSKLHTAHIHGVFNINIF